MVRGVPDTVTVCALADAVTVRAVADSVTVMALTDAVIVEGNGHVEPEITETVCIETEAVPVTVTVVPSAETWLVMTTLLTTVTTLAETVKVVPGRVTTDSDCKAVVTTVTAVVVTLVMVTGSAHEPGTVLTTMTVEASLKTVENSVTICASGVIKSVTVCTSQSGVMKSVTVCTSQSGVMKSVTVCTSQSGVLKSVTVCISKSVTKITEVWQSHSSIISVLVMIRGGGQSEGVSWRGSSSTAFSISGPGVISAKGGSPGSVGLEGDTMLRVFQGKILRLSCAGEAQMGVTTTRTSARFQRMAIKTT
jgi:hypothetical protein